MSAASSSSVGSPTQPGRDDAPQPAAPATRSSTPASRAASTAGTEVLARLERPDREDVVALRDRPVGREDRVDAVRDDADPLDGHVEQLDELVAGERGDGDDRVRGRTPRA